MMDRLTILITIDFGLTRSESKVTVAKMRSEPLKLGNEGQRKKIMGRSLF